MELPADLQWVRSGRTSNASLRNKIVDVEEDERGVVTPPGHLRTYLGSAPGVGKTYSMLAEGQRRAAAGERVVVGWVERHGRSETRAQLGDLEVIAPREATYRGVAFPELDVQAVLASEPDLVLVDELAHRVPDTGRGRWEDVAELLAAGLDVATTANVANLESVRDYAARLTGVGVVESVPDQFLRDGEVIVVPIAVDALRRRIADGKVYSADRVGGALAEYFQTSNLEALNELCDAWITDRVEDVGQDLLARRGLSERPTVVAGVSGSERGEAVIRAAAQFASDRDADFEVIHVDAADSPLSRRSELERDHALAVKLGGQFRTIEGIAPAHAIADVARDRGAPLVVVARGRSRLLRPARFTMAARLRRLLPDATVEEV
jgi:two-component system sensor histidine kinase KdpD